jgi:hypothetical protein
MEKVKIDHAKIKALAQMIHESNKVFCEALGDNSQDHWSEAKGYNHESAMVGVRALFENPDMTPAQSHDAWMEAKKKDGWVYGEKKCWDKKTHPSMVPYEDLSAAERYKDHLVQSIVKGYIDFVGRDNYVLV